MHLLPTVAAWVEKKASRHQLYGQDYDAFVRGVIGMSDGLPLVAGSAPLKVKLAPDDAAHPGAGKAVFTDLPAADVLACFKCTDLSCLNSVTYRFDDRFLALSRPNSEKGALPFGAGWVINGPKPLGPEQPWAYACGISRYSLETRKR
jgi:hypothetical protein